MPLKKDLQSQCKAAGIDHKGNIADLTQRLREYRNRLQHHTNTEQCSSPDQEEPKCDAILVTKSKVGGDEDMKREAKVAFGKALEKDDLNVTRERGEIYVGNPRGLGLAGVAARICLLETEISALKEKDVQKDGEISSLKEKVTELKEKVTELKGSVSTLKLAGQDYRRVRQRFISTFVRDKLLSPKQSDFDMIKEVNFTVYRGDAVTDALLYDERGGREDIYAFEALYGLHPSDVKKISRHEIIDILNLHATVQANKDKTGTQDFYKKFAEFILAFKRSNYKVDFLAGNSTDRTFIAYTSLSTCQQYNDNA